ncbi:YdcF family protein [Aureimonas mangrovi]|uniref:YdcF family protein n=1 Tax=Aureimonas mangrovi TaxID=2758041 RepID=UPI00163D5F4C|nr:YdcF family protein [Aureimonas mangrovi]
MRKSGGKTGGKRRGRAKLALVLALLVLVAGGAYLAGGFMRFAQEVAALSTPASISGADGIVVLTGGSQRVERAVRLLERGEGQRLLISGVNPGTGPLSLSRLTSADPALFECCVDLDYAALDTVGNAEATVSWAREHGLRRLILVTSDYHMPRSMIELASVPDAPAVVPYPVSLEKLWRPDGAPTRLGLRLLATEYAKVLAVKARIALGVDYAHMRARQIAQHSSAGHAGTPEP